MEREIVITSTEDRDEYTNEEIKVNIPIKTANNIAQVYLENIGSDSLYEAEAALNDLSDIINRIIKQENKVGDASDWHNFAVDIARKDLFDMACDLLECGLSIFPKDIDLLADYIQYGTSCGREDKCKQYYKTLSKIPKIRWGWRGYSFSVNYLTYLWGKSDSESELEKLQKEMLDIVELFKKNLPYEEESYRCEADIYKLINDRKKEEESLRFALSNLKIAPKCALRLSDLLFERGEYEEALIQIQRGLRDAMQTQHSVNEGYLYYLMGLTKMAIPLQTGEQFSEELTMEIYADFDISLKQERRAAYLNTMKSKTIVLINKSGFPIPDKYEDLNYLVQ